MAAKTLKISQKLILAQTVLIGLFSVASLLIFVALQMAHGAAEHRAESRRLLGAISETRAAMAERTSAFRGYLITADEKFVADIAAQQSSLDDSLARLDKAATTPGDRALAAEVRAELVNFRSSAMEPGLRLMASPETRAQAPGVLKVGAPVYRAAGRGMDQLTRSARAALDASTVAEAQTFLFSNLTFLVSGAIATASAFAVGWGLWRGIAQPVVAMTGVMKALAAGDLEVAIPDTERTDELGEMAESVKVFRDTAVARRAAEGDAEAARGRAETERRTTEAEAIAAQQALVVGSFGEGLRALAAGRLTWRVTTELPDAYLGLRDDFNTATDSLRTALRAVVASAESVQAGSGEISTAAGDLSQRTEHQAATLEETAAALEQVMATVTRTADGAGQAHALIDGARGDAQTSAIVMQEAIRAMGEIRSSANQISQIIGVIDEISFQTNLLALNAGVEAARAGEAGRGFAVVAQEVRALAQRSADAAKEIKVLISTSTSQVEKGVGLVDRTGKALETIIGKVGDFASLVGEIAASAREQATALTQVNTAVNQMDLATQQNAAMVEETTAASQNLAREANVLGQLVAKFDVGDASAAKARSLRRAA
jgi:methyl-accepting chemotaxis protein